MTSPDLFGAAGAAPRGDRAWTVLEVTRRARQLIEAGFPRFWVRGEITGFKAYRSGHWYFALRDRQAQVRCVMWRGDNQRLKPPTEGLQVFLEAQPTIWEERGEFRLTVRQLIPTDAQGLWQLRFEEARRALERDGLLDPARKRPLPPYPTCVGVITSLDGAALRDIVSVLRRRWPPARVCVVPARVQGETAERDLLRALEIANRMDVLEVLIIGRGGGSREDLWAFNSERVARAVAAARVPTIAAVGHEIDVCLVELVADLRAPTPSAAAEAATPDQVAVRRGVDLLARRLGHGLLRRTELGAERMARTADRLEGAMRDQLDRRRHVLARLAQALDALSPLKVLQRGYAVARNETGAVLRRTEQLAAGRRFRLTVSDGDVQAVSEGRLP